MAIGLDCPTTFRMSVQHSARGKEKYESHLARTDVFHMERNKPMRCAILQRTKGQLAADKFEMVDTTAIV